MKIIQDVLISLFTDMRMLYDTHFTVRVSPFQTQTSTFLKLFKQAAALTASMDKDTILLNSAIYLLCTKFKFNSLIVH